MIDYDPEFPYEMQVYLRHFGFHFNKHLCDFAVSLMTVEVNGKEEELKPFTKDDVDDILKRYGVKVKNNKLYDYVYVANMCKADFLGKSVPDEKHLAMYIKDVIDDVDAEEGFVFNRWYADVRFTNNPIEWDEMI